jgi:hypothetical protein
LLVGLDGFSDKKELVLLGVLDVLLGESCPFAMAGYPKDHPGMVLLQEGGHNLEIRLAWAQGFDQVFVS